MVGLPAMWRDLVFVFVCPFRAHSGDEAEVVKAPVPSASPVIALVLS
jgi:hypothetical protein